MPTIYQQSRAYVRRWFERRGWKVLPFQEETWHAYQRGCHGLVHAPTGTGKTLALFLAPAIAWLAEHREWLRDLQRRERSKGLPPLGAPAHSAGEPPPLPRTSIERLNRDPPRRRKPLRRNPHGRLRVLWITPLRALATDTEANLQQTVAELGVPWTVEKRTADSDPRIRNRQRKQFPDVLITTPESLTLMISWPDHAERFSALQLIVVDEWHELMGTKRGVQTELALARVRRVCPGVRQWGLSATMGNLPAALNTLTGADHSDNAVLIHGDLAKTIEIESLIPADMERFPWAGHLGIRLAGEVAGRIGQYASSLVFTNTRSQTEFWYQALLAAKPDLAGQIAVHHGSLDRGVRNWVEAALRDGSLRCCVCTSSLDLGVDFTAVDHVFQIGSPKGNARLLQRAGRSGHAPGAVSRVTFVPTNAIELIEVAALRDAIAAGQIESRDPLPKPLDVLAQHVVTVALGGGFVADELLAEVRSTAAYRSLSDTEWQWVLDFAQRGGDSLDAYPDFQRIELVAGRYLVTDKKIARMHRLSIGTIVSDAAVKVQYLKGRSLGTVEETFISRMEPGDRFLLGGKLLELVSVRDNTAWVRSGKGTTTAIPRWLGGRMPLSNELSQAIREQLQAAARGQFPSAEMRAVKPLLELQAEWSDIPDADQLLIERLRNRDGYHLFFYPFDGRLVHEGLAALLAYRMSRLQPISFSMAMNDYGFVLVSPTEPPLEAALTARLLHAEEVAEDIWNSVNASEMSRRQFRQIARIAGLVFEGYPGTRQTSRHLQASSNLFYDVFSTYDPDNLLLKQAQREVLEQQLEQRRLVAVLRRLQAHPVLIRDLQRPTPLAFGLLVDGLRDRLSSETLSDRIKRMQASLEQAAILPRT